MTMPSNSADTKVHPATATPALGFHRVSKTFKSGTRALDKVTLDIDAERFTVLLGPSGSGKTTLLRAAVGLTALVEGEITLAGEPITGRRLKAARRRMGMVHQDFGLSERLTTAQNVMAGAAASIGWVRVLFQAYPKAIQLKACALLARVGLDEVQVNRRAGNLSGGQRQRVGIARALINDPLVILADEPVASLDPATAREIMALLREAAAERGAAVLCSLHQIDLARQFADRIVGLKDGQIVFDGAPADLTPAALALIFEGPETRMRPIAAVA